MGQEASSATAPASRSHPQPQRGPISLPRQPMQHEGILKIAQTPFQNCQKIEVEGRVYFLEKTRTNLKNLVRNKSRLRKHFSQSEVQQVIENILYPLAYLESLSTPYPYLTLQNVYVCSGLFKLLPPSAIKLQIYSKLKQVMKQKTGEYVPASPELIIAVRCQQPQIHQQEILHKSNVFALGLILLEICTLKQSSECFDLQTYDILDQVVMERIEEIQGRYSNRIARFVANMLDYDYEERMMPKEMSIWVNREINEDTGANPQIKSTPSFPKNEVNLQNTQMIKSRLVQEQNSTPTKPAPEPEKQQGQNSQRTSQKRISQIRNKIIKEKIKAEKEIIEEKGLQRSRKRTSSYINLKQGERGGIGNRNLPNPYLNPNHLNKSSQKPSQPRSRSPYLAPSAPSTPDLGIHDLTKLRPLAPLAYPSKYSYTNNQEDDLVSDRDRTVNLKYKYNLVQEEGESVRLSSNRKREGERFVRVERCIAEFQRVGNREARAVGEGRKYDYGEVLGDVYENRENRWAAREEKPLTRSPSYRNYQQNTNISDFSFEPQKTSPQNNPKKALAREQRMSPEEQPRKYQPLMPKQNIRAPVAEKATKQSHPYQRHQQLQQTDAKPKRVTKQNDDILLIKKQIERSKRLIEEVKRSEAENST